MKVGRVRDQGQRFADDKGVAGLGVVAVSGDFEHHFGAVGLGIELIDQGKADTEDADTANGLEGE